MTTSAIGPSIDPTLAYKINQTQQHKGFVDIFFLLPITNREVTNIAKIAKIIHWF